MGIFTLKSKKKTDEDRMVGVYIDPQIHSYLSLFTLAKGINKSNLMRSLIASWYERECKDNPPRELVRVLLKKAQEKWDKDKNRLGFSDFIWQLEKELLSKGVTREHIAIILENIEK